MQRLTVLLVVIGLGCVGAAGAEEVWVDFGSHRSASPTEVQISRSDTSVLELEFEVPGVILEATSAEGRAFTRVVIPGAGSIGDIGAPQLPAFRRFVEMPEGATVAVDTNVIEWQTVDLAARGLSGVLLPAQLSIPKCDCQEARDWRFSFKEDVYSGIVGHDLVSVEAPVTMRDHRMVKLAFAPIQYDVDAGILRVASRVSLRLTFEGGDEVATSARKARLSSRAFDAFLGRAALNLGFSDSADGRDAGWAYPGDAPIEFLIVTPPGFVSDLQPFVEWKTSCGYNVTVVTTAVTGTSTTDIKAYITGLYNGATPPVYILMIGDSPGVLATYTTGNAVGGTDLPYVQMDGDLFPDMMISRWPIDDSTELVNMRDKILHYEQPTAANSAWLNRALFLAGDDYLGRVTTHEDVRTELMEAPPNNAETEQWWGDTENPTTAELIADLNTGRAWAVYSAHSGPGGWSGDPSLSNGDMPNFGNTDMYPIAHGHSCSSNEWASNGDVFGEAAVIQPSKGFVSYWGGSNSTYWDGDDWLERGFFDALVEADMAVNVGDWDGHFSAVAACYAGLTEVSMNGGGSAGETYYWEIYNLNGDPTLDPFTRQPTALNVGAPGAIAPSATDTFTVTVTDASSGAVPGALVAASQDGVLLGAGYSDGTGTAIFHIDAPAAGTPLLVRVTGHNYLPTDEIVMVGAEADGVLTLNASIYPCSASAVIDVFDANATGPFSVTLQTAPGNSTLVTMTDVGDVTGHFQGSAVLGADLVVADGDTLSAIYNDQDNGTGSSETKTVTAAVDCAGPVISNVQLSVSEGSMTVTFDTHEPGTTVVTYGMSTPPATVVSSDSLVTSHTVEIEGLESCTTYYVQLASDDALGNHTVDNNGGAYYQEQTGGWQTFFSEDFGSDPGWTIDNGGNGHGWAFGVPQGLGGEYGGPDPTSGFTGDNVYGVNLAGDYDNSLNTDQLKLTTPAIDCGEATSVFLSFRRWLGVESPTFDHARVQVSVDGGSSWPTVWENTSSIEESAWSEQTIDLTSVAAGQSDVRVRWTQGETDSSWQYCGWNVDDVVVEGAAPCGESSALFLDGFEGGDCSLWSYETP